MILKKAWAGSLNPKVLSQNLCLATHQPEKKITNSSCDDATSPRKQNEYIELQHLCLIQEFPLGFV